MATVGRCQLVSAWTSADRGNRRDFPQLPAKLNPARQLQTGQAMARGRNSRGMTVIELLAATGLLALVGGGVALVTRPGTGQDDTSSEQLAAPIASALSVWQASHAGECPTIGQLEAQGFLARGTRRDDAWGESFRVACDGGTLALISAGPDGALSTKDDLRIAVH